MAWRSSNRRPLACQQQRCEQREDRDSGEVRRKVRRFEATIVQRHLGDLLEYDDGSNQEAPPHHRVTVSRGESQVDEQAKQPYEQEVSALVTTGQAGDEVQGYHRTRQILSASAGLAAPEILAALIADWRRHLGASPPGDDTTVVVLKRG